MKTIDAALLREMFDYNPESGRLVRRVWTSPRATPGMIAGSKHSSGYVYISLNNKLHKAHRLIWLWNYGVVPRMLDHINGIRDDNRLCNLREVTAVQNALNQKLRVNSKSGVKGVSFHKEGQWRATHALGGKQKHLGVFSNIDDAAMAVRKHRSEVAGEYANHG